MLAPTWVCTGRCTFRWRTWSNGQVQELQLELEPPAERNTIRNPLEAGFKARPVSVNSAAATAAAAAEHCGCRVACILQGRDCAQRGCDCTLFSPLAIASVSATGSKVCRRFVEGLEQHQVGLGMTSACCRV